MRCSRSSARSWPRYSRSKTADFYGRRFAPAPFLRGWSLRPILRTVKDARDFDRIADVDRRGASRRNLIRIFRIGKKRDLARLCIIKPGDGFDFDVAIARFTARTQQPKGSMKEASLSLRPSGIGNATLSTCVAGIRTNSAKPPGSRLVFLNCGHIEMFPR